MTTMTKVQAEALAAFVSRMRPEWRTVGIVAALEKAAPTADAWDVAHALLNLTAEPSVLTPGLLPGPGPHWRRDDGSKPARRGDHDVHCPEHPSSVHPCPQCAAKRCTPDPVEHADYLAAKEALRGRQGPAPVEQRHKPTPTEELAIARARADREARP
jgi:hypothetical protein